VKMEDEPLPMPVAQIMPAAVVSQVNVGSLATLKKRHRKRLHNGMSGSCISFHIVTVC